MKRLELYRVKRDLERMLEFFTHLAVPEECINNYLMGERLYSLDVYSRSYEIMNKDYE